MGWRASPIFVVHEHGRKCIMPTIRDEKSLQSAHRSQSETALADANPRLPQVHVSSLSTVPNLLRPLGRSRNTVHMETINEEDPETSHFRVADTKGRHPDLDALDKGWDTTLYRHKTQNGEVFLAGKYYAPVEMAHVEQENSESSSCAPGTPVGGDSASDVSTTTRAVFSRQAFVLSFDVGKIDLIIKKLKNQ
ncbi:MAG: hypothetical protein FD149_2682 [Rhodospirillaceae bacterium]|nr:MAG: hypothetical protein FD149_2682 [Rhodospirillaceae bacterium]